MPEAWPSSGNVKAYEAAGHACARAPEYQSKYGLDFEQFCDNGLPCYRLPQYSDEYGHGFNGPNGENLMVAEDDVVELCKRLGISSLAEKEAARAAAEARAEERAKQL